MKDQKALSIARECRMFAAAACVTLLVLAAAACDNKSDPTAPADSTITVSANPQTVLVPRGGGDANTEITATLRSKNGTRLPDQEVTFSTTAGNLDPIADTPILTNSNGQARSILRTNQAATVTARSGGISGTTQILTTPSIISQVQLDVENRENGGQRLLSCADHLDLVATVLDPNSDPVIGVTVVFLQTGTLAGNFSPSQGSTDINGEVLSTWTAGSNCTTLCVSGDPNSSGNCTLSLAASSGGLTSFPVPVQDNIP